MILTSLTLADRKRIQSRKAGWSPSKDEERTEESMNDKSSNETRVSTIQDFKVTRINSE
ncbi:MAG: hypothetical protein ACLFVI_03635 [Archaeoglobaceae archaeon]